MTSSDPMAQAAASFASGRLDEARRLCARILDAQPRHFYALHLSAAIAAQEGRDEECVQLATRALEIHPGHPEVLSNRGAALRSLCRYDEALRDYEAALARAPRSAVIVCNRGVTLAALGRHADAVASYDEALRLDPDFARARYNRALSRLTLGDLAGGWDDYESRWKGGETPMPPRPFDCPGFSATDWGRGHRIALWSEQGIGDEMLFSSLVTDLAERGEAFVLEADRRLVAPMRRAHPAWDIVEKDRSAAAFASCDRHLALGSLPRLLRPTFESFRHPRPALVAADGERAAQYRARLTGGGERVIGISWRTFQPRHRRFFERIRSAPLSSFMDLSRLPGVRLLDLQYGDTRAEREAFAAAGGRLARLEQLDAFNDIDGLLAAVAACDAVITTANVTAHLGGEIGKRTLLLYPPGRPPAHYWAPDASGRSRWYPSVEIVPGGPADDWRALLERAGKMLGLERPNQAR